MKLFEAFLGGARFRAFLLSLAKYCEHALWSAAAPLPLFPLLSPLGILRSSIGGRDGYTTLVCAGLLIIRKHRMVRRGRRRILFQQIHHHFDRLIQLRVVS